MGGIPIRFWVYSRYRRVGQDAHSGRGAERGKYLVIRALLLALCLCATGARGAALTVLISTEVGTHVGGQYASDAQVIGLLPAVAVTDLGIPDGADLDALAVLPDGSLAFSCSSAFELGSSRYRAGDVVIKRPSQAPTRLFSASDLGLPAGADIDALAIAQGNVFVSIAESANLAGGALVTPASILTAPLDNLHAATVLPVPAISMIGANVDALEVIGSTVYVSFDRAVSINGALVRSSDVIRVAGSSVEIVQSVRDALLQTSGLDAFAMLDDGIFGDSYE